MQFCRLTLLVALMVCACSTPSAPSFPTGVGPNATIEALSARVEALSAQLALSPLPDRTPTPSPTPRQSNPGITRAVGSLSPLAEVTELTTADVTVASNPEPTVMFAPTPEPMAEPTPAPPPTLFPTRTVRPTSVADAAPCRIGQIKGNRTSRIYHVPGGGSYPRTANNVECFDTEDQAVAAGYRKARN